MQESPNSHQQENKKTSLEKRLELIRSGYGNVQRVLRIGEYETTSQVSGNIKNSLLSQDTRTMFVRTNTGAIVTENREIITERLSGCVGLLMRGPGFNYLVHLTPNLELGYYYHRFQNSSELAEKSIKKVFDALPQNVAKTDLSVNIIANVPDETDGAYGREKLTAAWNRIKENIEKLGVDNIKLTELPMDETLLYFSPLDPGEVYAIGGKVEIGPDGNYISNPGELIEQKISVAHHYES